MEPLDISTSDTVAGLTLPGTTLPIAQPSPSLPLPLTPTWETLQVSFLNVYNKKYLNLSKFMCTAIFGCNKKDMNDVFIDDNSAVTFLKFQKRFFDHKVQGIFSK